jgi:hypothetical protein
MLVKVILSCSFLLLKVAPVAKVSEGGFSHNFTGFKGTNTYSKLLNNSVDSKNFVFIN